MSSSAAPSSSVCVTAPSRLHFGLFALQDVAGPAYGGVGAMVEQPGLELTFAKQRKFSCHGDGELARRITRAAQLWSQRHFDGALPQCQITVHSAPVLHAGLGTGTQLAMSVAEGLRRLFGLPGQSAEQLATSVGRGLRSAVGAHGFVHGGLIIDDGKHAPDSLGKLRARSAIPSQWRFVLIRPLSAEGLAGDREHTAFAKLPGIDVAITKQLRQLAIEQLLPAVESADFPGFCQSVRQYGRLAGECFAPVQGGVYNGETLTRLVDELESLGVEAVGQSSWGPTLFCVLPQLAEAEKLAARLRHELPRVSPVEILVSAPANRGADVRLID